MAATDSAGHSAIHTSASGSSSSASPPDSTSFVGTHRKRVEDDEYDDASFDEPPVKAAKGKAGENKHSVGHAHANGSGTSNKGKKPISEKRRDQNRRAQQAFRDRKEARVNDLEAKVAELAQLNEQKDKENASLRELVEQLRAESSRPSGSPVSLPTAEPSFTFQLPGAEDKRSPAPSVGLQEGFLSGMSGYAFSPQSVAPAEDGLFKDSTVSLPEAINSPSAALSPGNFGSIEDYLALDDGTTVEMNALEGGSPSSTSEVRTPGDSYEDELCSKFTRHVSCNERAARVIADADEADAARLQEMLRSAKASSGGDESHFDPDVLTKQLLSSADSDAQAQRLRKLLQDSGYI